MAATLLALSACDGGSGGSAGDGGSAGNGGNDSPASTAAVEPAASSSLSEPDALFQDAAGSSLDSNASGDAAPAISGVPGQTVDCAGALPCRWIGVDSGFAVTLLRADNTGRDGRLELHLAVDSTHDTALGVSLAADATDNTGSSTAPVRVTLDGTPATGTRTLAAGQRLSALIDFDAASSGSTLPGWSLLLDDNGTARPATFANLPLGPLPGTTVDCSGTLPCLWTSDDGLATVELTAAGGFSSARRLHVDFRVTAMQPLAMLAGPETVAIGADGSPFRVRAQQLGNSTLGGGQSVALTGGLPVSGRVDFFRSPSSPTLLATLVLDLYRDAPVPRWRPSFANVPALAP